MASSAASSSRRAERHPASRCMDRRSAALSPDMTVVEGVDAEFTRFYGKDNDEFSLLLDGITVLVVAPREARPL